MTRIRFLAALCAAPLAPAAAQSTAVGLASQLTTSYNMDNTLSPDGKQMIFIKIIEGREQLFVMATDGSWERQITRDSAHHEDPAWSPDGKRVAFIRITRDEQRVWLMNPDGSAQEPLTPIAQHALHPSWSPDSRRILYCTDDDLRPPVKNEAEIYAIDLGTKQVTTLISGGVNTFPVMSPDGKRIVFRRMLETNSEVFVADADGKNAKNLTNHPAFEGWPAWSPDGTEIAFAGNRNSAYQVFVMKADGSEVRLIANTEGRATVPRWSPDGKTIYFTLCRNVDNTTSGRACEIMRAASR